MHYLIIVDYSAVEKFRQETHKWQGLFNLLTQHDGIIFTANEGKDLDQCKDFWGTELPIEPWVRENTHVQYIVQKSLVDGIRTRIEKVKERPQGNRLVFFGEFSDNVVADLKDKYKQDLGKRLVIFDNIATDQFDVFFGTLEGDYGVTFGCSKFDEFIRFFDIPVKRQFKKDAIQALKTYEGDSLDFSGVISGAEGGYNFAFSTSDMQEMIAAIPKSVKFLNLKTALMGCTSNNVMRILKKIPWTVEEFDVSLNDPRVLLQVGDFFKKKEGERWVFLRQTYTESNPQMRSSMKHHVPQKSVARTMESNKEIVGNTGLLNVIKSQRQELCTLKTKVRELTQKLAIAEKKNSELSGALNDEKQKNSKSSELNRQTSVPTTKKEKEVFYYKRTEDEELNRMLGFVCSLVNEPAAEKLEQDEEKKNTKSSQYSKQNSLPERETDVVSFFKSMSLEEKRDTSLHGSAACQLKK